MAAAPQQGPGSSAIDSTFTIIEDLSADGEPDSLELRIFGESLDAPFEWTVRIWVQRQLVFEHQSDDSSFDQWFGEPEYRGTGNREQDKTSWYFDQLPNALVRRHQFRVGHRIFDRRSGAGVYQAVERELHGLVDERTVQEIIERVVERLQAGTILLTIPITPFGSGFPMIFVEEVGEFIPAFVW